VGGEVEVKGTSLRGHTVRLADGEVTAAGVDAGVERAQLGQCKATFAGQCAAGVTFLDGVVCLAGFGGTARNVARNASLGGSRRWGRGRATGSNAVRATNLRKVALDG